jgi:hypothetical protein
VCVYIVVNVCVLVCGLCVCVRVSVSDFQVVCLCMVVQVIVGSGGKGPFVLRATTLDQETLQWLQQDEYFGSQAFRGIFSETAKGTQQVPEEAKVFFPEQSITHMNRCIYIQIYIYISLSIYISLFLYIYISMSIYISIYIYI